MVAKLKRDSYQDFARRLLRACNESRAMPKTGERGFTKALGALVGIGYKGAEKWIKGDGMPDMGNAVILSKRLDVAFEWLMTGRGPMRPSHAQEESPEYHVRESEMRHEPPVEMVSLDDEMARLPVDLRISIRRIIEALAVKNQT